MAGTLSYNVVRIPLKTPFETSFGRLIDRNAIIFSLDIDGILAYSEAVTDIDPFYGYEFNQGLLYLVSRFMSKFLAKSSSPSEFLELSKVVKGNNMAKAAIEMLMWDYEARKQNKPLFKLLGETKNMVSVGISIGMDTNANMIKRIESSLREGYKRIKVKIKKGKEMSILRSIRDFYPEIVLTADANADYTINDIEILKKIDRFDLQYIEQPLNHDDLLDHSRLAKEISTPICLDESITDPEKARKAFDLGSCSVINIKPGRVGGLLNSVRIAEIVKENGGHCWIGGMLETGIGRAFNISLASLKNVDYPGDTSPNSRYFEMDIVKNPFIMRNGKIKPSEIEGSGAVVDKQRILDYTVESGILKEW